MKTLIKLLENQFHDAILDYDPSQTKTGSDFLNITINNINIEVEYCPLKGFGLSARKSIYGEGPDEIFQTSNETFERIKTIVKII